ncbi:hypothetical protein ANCCAN_01321 [Ancylostoma caninum]|uniref:Uncharacterized protein n=1 Tax=Ancylostoma caninum TaxID=29170 RepID=A0A368H7Q4_ANCCA|nr:hypothetical protein ANCCAN_01321 [Ancylostoma caninum]
MVRKTGTLELRHSLQLPTETPVAAPRTMDQYLNQLGIGGSQAHALLRQAQSHHLAQQAQFLAAAAVARLPDRPHPSYNSSIMPLHADLLQMATQVPISVSAGLPGGSVCYLQLFCLSRVSACVWIS